MKQSLRFYTSYFLIPGFILKSGVVVLLFGSTMFSYACSPADTLTYFFYLLLLTVFLIPLVDVPILAVLRFQQLRGHPIARKVRSISYAVVVGLGVGIATILIALILVSLIAMLGLPFCGRR
ncbi:hypothetical protein KBD71_01565 [Candidatus Woesebacteria bacterium]|nr:hypothetical protein [Candidatus Woesebacteria bacterium]